MNKSVGHRVRGKVEPFIRKYVVDLCIAAVFIFFAIVLAERPGVKYPAPSAAAKPRAAVPGKKSRVSAQHKEEPESKEIYKNMDSPDFTPDEFRIQGKDVRKLCEAIKKDGYKFGAAHAYADTVEWLNGLLQLSDLFDKVVTEKPELVLPGEAVKLKDLTRETRQRPFKSLKGDEQRAIERLNRLMLETAYPKEAPKSRNLYVRNLFETGGNYAPPPELIIIPENPYNLIAVLEGKEKRAVLRDYTGKVVSLKTGDKMVDGAVVVRIDRLSVTARLGKKEKEYRIFDVKKNKGKDKK